MKLKEVCKIIGGNPAPKEGFSSSAEALPFVKMKDLGKAHLTNNLVEIETRIDPNFGRKKNMRIIKKGSVLLPRSGSVALNHRAILGQDSFMVSHICALEVISKELFNEYLYYFLCTKRLDNITKKTTGLDAITFEDIGNIKINFPSLSEQKKIVQILDTADSLRQKRKEQLKLIDDYLKSVFLEMFGDPVRNEKGWKVFKMLDICSKVTDGTHDKPKRLDSGVKFITGKHIKPFKIDYENSDYVSRSDHEEIYRRCNPEKGDVLYTNIGVNVGTAALNTAEYPFSMKNVALLKLTKEKVAPRYIESFLNYEFVRNDVLRKISLGGAQQFIGLQDIKKIDIPIPSLDIQNKFVSIVEQVEQTKQKMRASLAEMDNHFNALMQRYFG
ncbi:MAG: restriction endonuclease subunit S [Nitrospinae bacterium]|nr:restriction endonuclease subunit S [Nitrospinota bacterium]